MNRKKFSKWVAIVTMICISIAMTMGSVFAAPGDIPPTDPSSLTVHKLKQADGVQAEPGDGMKKTKAEADAFGTALPGAEFTLTRIDTAWAKANISTTSVPEDVLAAATAAGMAAIVSSKITDTAGEAVWTALPVGIYILEETDTPTGLYGSVASIISLPYGYNSDPSAPTDFNYDVHVYPKNITSPIDKEVVGEVDIFGVGNTVPYIITAKKTVRLVDDTDNPMVYGSFIIRDTPLDYRFTYTANSAVLTMFPNPGGAGADLLVLNTDYTETITAVDPSDSTKGQTLTWTFTNEGLCKLEENNVTEVRVSVDVVINANAIGTEVVIENNADLTYRGNGENSETTIDVENPPVIKLQGIEITKVDSLDNKLLLANAKFMLALVPNPSAANNTDWLHYKGDPSAAIIEVTTDAAGKATFAGLEGLDDPDFKVYYLVETAAPDGNYQLTKTVIPVNVYNHVITKVEVPNAKIGDPPIDEHTFQLPKTGDVGTRMFKVFGLVSMGAALMTVLIILRKRKKEMARR